jgi:small subunit ribosomal protein S17
MKKLIGQIISDKMTKTKVVAITEIRRHKIYQKSYKVTSKIKAHDEKDEYKMGDMVEIQASRPISSGKSWKIMGKIK